MKDFGNLFQIGRIGKPHGVRGELRMQYTDDVFDRTGADFVFLNIDGLPVPFFIESYRFRSDDLVLMKFEDIDTAERAAELTGCEVYFPRDLSDSTGNDISWAEIIGYKVVDSADSAEVGTIRSVDDSTMNILFTIVDGKGEEHLIPVGDDLIKNVDKENKTITMFIPDGLLKL